MGVHFTNQPPSPSDGRNSPVYVEANSSIPGQVPDELEPLTPHGGTMRARRLCVPINNLGTNLVTFSDWQDVANRFASPLTY